MLARRARCAVRPRRAASAASVGASLGRVRRPSSSAASPTSTVRLVVNGVAVAVENPPADRTLLEYVRGDLGLTAAKLVCGEGGCGACSVIVRDGPDAVPRALNACLTPLCSVHGAEITTPEAAAAGGTGARVAAAMAECFGSQCGFCTPGFTSALTAALERNPAASREELLASISSNLCRCTGYRSIADAVEALSTPAGEGAGAAAAAAAATAAAAAAAAAAASQHPPLSVRDSLGREWHTPNTLDELLRLKAENPDARVVAGNTEVGIEMKLQGRDYACLLSPARVPELAELRADDSAGAIRVGAAVPLSRLEAFLAARAALPSLPAEAAAGWRSVLRQIHWFSGPAVREAATLGGNVMTASPISDLNPLLLAAGATLELRSAARGTREVPADAFFRGYRQTAAEPDEVLVSVSVPEARAGEHVRVYKQARRREDDISVANAALRVRLDEGGAVAECRLAFGGMGPSVVRAPETERALVGRRLADDGTLADALRSLAAELALPESAPGGMAAYRTSLCLGFFRKFWGECGGAEPRAGDELPAPFPRTSRVYPPHPDAAASARGGIVEVGRSALHMTARAQASGAAQYLDDVPAAAGELHAVLVLSPRASGRLAGVDAAAALEIPGVVAVYTARDVPGCNSFGAVVHDDVIFADGSVSYAGQAVGVLVAEDEDTARRAARAVSVRFDDGDAAGGEPPVLSVDDARARGSFFEHYAKEIACGDAEAEMARCEHVLEGEVRAGGQEHFYFETQAQLVTPVDGGAEVRIVSSTQNTSETQQVVATALGVRQHAVSCHVKRIGGGFGGKETSSVGITAAAAVAAHHTGRPVRLVPSRADDIALTGKRHPFVGRYRVGFDGDGTVRAVDTELVANGGYSTDLSMAVTDRALFFSDGSYGVPNLRARGRVARTNLPSNTAFRGFGGPQGMLVAEGWVDRVAHHLGLAPEEVRRRNLYRYGQPTHYGQPVNVHFERVWEECERVAGGFAERRAAIDAFNAAHTTRKRGFAVVPSKYGISFTFTPLNQGSALVHVYQADGSVRVSHGGVEMGQGLNTKVAQVAAHTLGVPLESVHVDESATDKVPNSSATAASMGSDIYGAAALDACRQIAERLAPYRQGGKMTFAEAAQAAWFDRVSLSAAGFHKVPVTGYDWETGAGHPFHYFTAGAAASECEVDLLTGQHATLRTDLVMDVGSSINPAIDLGQIEGAFAQGAGWLTVEELVWGDPAQQPWVRPAGRWHTNGPGNYKIPSVDDVAHEFNVELIDAAERSPAVHSSRGVGEPPLQLATSVAFAIRDAVGAARRDAGVTDYLELRTPLTSERIRMACTDGILREVLGDAAESYEPRACV